MFGDMTIKDLSPKDTNSGGKEYYLYNYRVICEASTFDEISLGMKAIITNNSAEGQMIYASVYLLKMMLHLLVQFLNKRKK